MPTPPFFFFAPYIMGQNEGKENIGDIIHKNYLGLMDSKYQHRSGEIVLVGTSL